MEKKLKHTHTHTHIHIHTQVSHFAERGGPQRARTKRKAFEMNLEGSGHIKEC